MSKPSKKMMKFGIDILRALAGALTGISKYDIADLRIPEYAVGEALIAGKNKTCIILEIDLDAPAGIEYTVLLDGEVHDRVAESCLGDWNILSEIEIDIFDLQTQDIVIKS